MNLKILASLLVMGMASAGMGFGTYAYFSSSQESNDNLFQAGTVVLALGEGESAPFLTGNNLIPGGPTVSGTTTVASAGTITGSNTALDLRVTNVRVYDSDGTDVSGTQLADWFLDNLTVKAFTYDGVALFSADTALSAVKDVVKTVGTPSAAGTDVFMEVQLSSAAENEHQGYSAKIDFEFLLRQTAAPALGSS